MLVQKLTLILIDRVATCWVLQKVQLDKQNIKITVKKLEAVEKINF